LKLHTAMMSQRPLESIRFPEISLTIFGPVACQYLIDMSAAAAWKA
jgi:crotonobetainyl-CoA:carnitine CoA-transferase CaiB-like acyl-CoA transferase